MNLSKRKKLILNRSRRFDLWCRPVDTLKNWLAGLSAIGSEYPWVCRRNCCLRTDLRFSQARESDGKLGA